MKLLIQLRYCIVGMLVSSMIILLEINSKIDFGKFINQFYPCEQDIRITFSCYGVWDLYLTIFMLVILIAFAVVLIIKTARYVLNRLNH